MIVFENSFVRTGRAGGLHKAPASNGKAAPAAETAA